MEPFENNTQHYELVSITRAPNSTDPFAYFLEFRNPNGTLNKDYWEYFRLVSDLSRLRYFTYNHFVLLSSCYPQDTNEDFFKSEINTFCEYIFKRPDLLAEPLIKNFFNLSAPDAFSISLDFSIPRVSTLIPFNVEFSQGGKYMILGLQNSSPLSRIGKIWSFIDSEVMGRIKIYEVNWNSNEVFKHYSSFDLYNRVISSLYRSKDDQLVLGFDNGEIVLYEMPLSFKVRKVQTVQICDDPILSIQEGKGQIFAVSLYNIKIFQGDNFRAIGGGSLRKRLEDDQISAFALNPDKETFFIGTIKGSMHMYQYSTKKGGDIVELKHLQTFSISCNQAIEKIKADGSYLFVAHKNDLSIWKTNYKDGKIEQVGLLQPDQIHASYFAKSRITGFHYLSEEKTIMAIYSNGLILYWSIKNGKLLGIKEDQKGESLGMFLLEDKMKMISYSYESTLNVWSVGSSKNQGSSSF